MNINLYSTPGVNTESKFQNLNFKLTKYNRPHGQLRSQIAFISETIISAFVGSIVRSERTRQPHSLCKSHFIGESTSTNGVPLAR